MNEKKFVDSNSKFKSNESIFVSQEKYSRFDEHNLDRFASET